MSHEATKLLMDEIARWEAAQAHLHRRFDRTRRDPSVSEVTDADLDALETLVFNLPWLENFGGMVKTDEHDRDADEEVLISNAPDDLCVLLVSAREALPLMIAEIRRARRASAQTLSDSATAHDGRAVREG